MLTSQPVNQIACGGASAHAATCGDSATLASASVSATRIPETAMTARNRMPWLPQQTGELHSAAHHGLGGGSPRARHSAMPRCISSSVGAAMAPLHWGPGVFHRAFGVQAACILTVRWSSPR